MSVKRLSIFALALLPLASGAWAADATNEQAQALEQQVRDWIGSTLGPNAKLPARPVQIAPEGDHYAVAVPLGDAADAPRITAVARPSDGGRWNIDNIRVPSPAEFKLDLPRPGDSDGKGAATMPVQYKLTFGQQAAQILFDPTYASPSTFNASFQNMDLAASGESLQQTAHADRTASTSTLRPTAGGRVDLLTDGSIEGYRISMKTPEIEQVDLNFGKVRMNGQVNGVSRDRAVQVLQALIAIGTMMDVARKAGLPEPKMDEKTFQVLLDALADFATGLSFDENIERVAVSYGGMAGSLNAVRIGLAVKADGGLLNARMDLGAEGLTLPEMGLGDLVQLIPAKVTLRPTVAGIATADITRLAKASQNGATPSPEDIKALFSHGGITTGLDSFSIEVAGTSFAGMGKLVFTSPEVFSGTAQITATNLDLLQQRVAANPQLAQALPVFILAKGVARTVNNQMVWDIAYQNGRVLVNNQDLSAMMGGAPPQQDQPKRPARPPQQQRPQQQHR